MVFIISNTVESPNNGQTLDPVFEVVLFGVQSIVVYCWSVLYRLYLHTTLQITAHYDPMFGITTSHRTEPSLLSTDLTLSGDGEVMADLKRGGGTIKGQSQSHDATDQLFF